MVRSSTLERHLLLSCLALAACDPPQVQRPVTPSLSGRTLCGWEVLEPDMARLHVAAQAEPTPVERVLVLSAAPDTPYADVERALADQKALVRLKLLVDDRWLVPATPARLIAPDPKAPPDPRGTVTTTVGHRRITRPRGAPAVRIADLRLDGERLELFVERDKAAGQRLAVSELSATLRAIDPPVGAFALRTSDTTSWREFVATVVAAACYDRGPGDEPHEVLFD